MATKRFCNIEVEAQSLPLWLPAFGRNSGDVHARNGRGLKARGQVPHNLVSPPKGEITEKKGDMLAQRRRRPLLRSTGSRGMRRSATRRLSTSESSRWHRRALPQRVCRIRPCPRRGRPRARKAAEHIQEPRRKARRLQDTQGNGVAAPHHGPAVVGNGEFRSSTPREVPSSNRTWRVRDSSVPTWRIASCMSACSEATTRSFKT